MLKLPGTFQSNPEFTLDAAYFNSDYTLTVQAKHNISESGIDSMVESTSVLLDNHLQRFSSQVKAKLEEKGIDSSIMDNISIDHMLNSFDTSNKRLSHFTSKLSYLKLTKVTIGTFYKTKNGLITGINRGGDFKNFHDSLKSLKNA